MITVGIITVSDRASAGEYEDHGGPAVRAACQGALDAFNALGPIAAEAVRFIERERNRLMRMPGAVCLH